MRSVRPLSLLALLSVCAVAAAQASSSDTAKIVDEGKNRNQVMQTLRELTNIGPVAGSAYRTFDISRFDEFF
ncbi:MAG: hypothetical protein EOP06_19030 [Proteobacteria bacterium]|nr:MAG: hypothetical protein EOP06_19030 [Pseudomonadota bacterium]